MNKLSEKQKTLLARALVILKNAKIRRYFESDPFMSVEVDKCLKLECEMIEEAKTPYQPSETMGAANA